MLRQFEQIHTLNKVLIRSNEDLDSFAYVASHDLKEPLRGIANYAKFLEEDYADALDEEGAYLIATIRSLSKRMNGLLDALLTYSRVDRTELSVGVCDLEDVLDEVTDLLQVSIQESGVELRRPTPLPTIECDRVRVGEIFSNLISNAIRYRDRQKAVNWVEVGVDVLEGNTWFYVADNGIGIAPEYHETIFMMFRRLHRDDSVYGKGTGAGLTIVQKIVERHDGELVLDSTPN
ncbi:MAG: ATP-binding protein, partial [Myxococcota bacterium]